MDVGIGLPDQVRDVRGRVIPSWASTAEGAGFSSLGTAGRIVYPSIMDTVAIAAAAGATSRVGLVTNVLLAPVWPPVLLAKEVANIDAVSGGRFTLGVGLGFRDDDFVVEGVGARGRGKRLDRDLEIYHEVWNGKPVGGSPNPAVPAGTRPVPLLFAGFASQAFQRMVKWGQGYIAASVPPTMAAGAFDQARAAWKEGGRDRRPRLLAIAYFALGDPDKGRANVRDYYSVSGAQIADMISQGVHTTPDGLRDAVKAFADIGTDELIFNPGLDDVDEVKRLAEVVL